MTATVARLMEQGRRYLRLLRWIVTDAYALFRGPIWLTLATSITGVLMQGAALGVILAYAYHLENDQAIRLGTLVLHPRTPETFIAAGVLSFLMLLGSALLIFAAKRTVASLSVNYERHCSGRVLALVGARPRQDVINHATRKVLRALLNEQAIHARGCGRALWTILAAAYPAATVLYMGIFIAVIDP